MNGEESDPIAHAGEDLVALREPAAVRLSALLVSVGIMVVGNGLAGTLLGVRAGLEGMRAESIGLLMSAYFIGFAMGFNDLEIARFMGASILGALVLQWPLGWLSDIIDRRLVIIGSAILSTAATGIAAITVSEGTSQHLFAFMFAYGGTMIPLYALSVAHVNDNIDSQRKSKGIAGIVIRRGAGRGCGTDARRAMPRLPTTG